jgi:hypothetical protein
LPQQTAWPGSGWIGALPPVQGVNFQLLVRGVRAIAACCAIAAIIYDAVRCACVTVLAAVLTDWHRQTTRHFWAKNKRDNYDFVGAIVTAPSSIGSTPYYVGAATITLDSIGATTTALDYSRFYRVRGLITPTLVGAALDTPTYVGA